MLSKKIRVVLMAGLCIGANVSVAFAQTTTSNRKDTGKLHSLIIMFDGLRPDYITKEQMPNLYAFGKKNCYGKQNHSVFPTVTRVNSASYATGTYPGKHGLMGNTVYFPQVNKKRGLNTGNAAELDRIADATSGHLLTAVSLGEILEANGERLMVFSSGSTGQAFLQNHKISGGGIINPDLILPGSLKTDVMQALGTPPPQAKPNAARHQWVIDAFMKYGLRVDGPLVSAIWFSDPDGTAHSEGIGSPLAVESLRIVDRQFGRIIDSMASRGLTHAFNIIVSTDHGFVTNIGTENLAALLIKQGLKKDTVSEDIIVAEGAIYVKDHDPAVIKQVVALLQKQAWIGPVFTKPNKKGDLKGFVDGTLSFEAIHWNHPERAADILVDENWSDQENNRGYKGTSYSRGVAGHGGSSPYEVHIPLLAGGPGFKKQYESNLPTANVDIVPTVLQLHRIAVPGQMDGRVMHELLLDSNHPSVHVKKETIETIVKQDWGTYRLTLERSVLGNCQYVDYTRVSRVFTTAKGK